MPTPLMLWMVSSLLLQDPGGQPPRITQAVVVSAAIEPVPLDALARAVTIVTRDEIRRLPSWSIADVLRLAGAVEVRSRGNFGTQTDLSLRGGGFGQVVVLVDGVRLNDSQSGHHSADIPVALERIERIEILRGTGSSLYGADALTGAINIITRQGAAPPSATVAAGDHGLVRGSVAAALSRNGVTTSLAGWGTRTSGFMFDRELATGGASFAAAFSARRQIAVSHLRNAFGANGFYGASPSKEWTEQTLVSLSDAFGSSRRRLSTRASYRTHGDHFRWDINRPGFAENQHRSHAVTVGATFRAGSDRNWTSIGAEVGKDWLRSNNLGDRDVNRIGALVELQRGLGRRTTIYPALRYDSYSSFADSWSPSLAGVVSLTPTVRMRASVGRAFRVPTFTERYYRDPAHLARAELAPERAWGGEAGVDWMPGDVTGAVTVFARRETDVIDWVRASVQDQWRTANIREVRTRGVEVSATRSGRAAFGRLEYTWLRADAPALVLLSKYTADYAPHSVAASGALRVGGATWVGGRADCKEKIDGRSYCGIDARVSRGFGRFELFVEATNLFDVQYQEIKGVDMAPRWLAAGLRVGH
jgi:iron complex outermembrane receptor protein